MMIPTIHLNGTSGHDLLRELREAIETIRDAEFALAKTCPNGRDYYPQGTGAIYRAQGEHAARMRKLREIAKELEEIAIAIT